MAVTSSLSMFKNIVEGTKDMSKEQLINMLDSDNKGKTDLNLSKSSNFIEIESNQIISNDTFEPVKEKSIDQISVLYSRSEIVQDLVDKVFNSFKLTSVNVDFFGMFASGIVPLGYIIQKVGDFEFFIKESKSLNLASMVSFIDRIRQGLLETGTVSVPLVYKRNIEGAILYSLAITEAEIQEIMKSYPDYQFGYTKDDNKLDNIRVVVRMNRR